VGNENITRQVGELRLYAIGRDNLLARGKKVEVIPREGLGSLDRGIYSQWLISKGKGTDGGIGMGENLYGDSKEKISV